MSEVVLEFRGVSGGPCSEHTCLLDNASFVLRSGETLAVRANSDMDYRGVLDLALGLETPASGQVLFRGREWCEMNAFEEAASRGDMGVVFELPGWVSSLTVAENIMLRVRHHTRRPEQEIYNEVMELTRVAGISDTSDLDSRPDVVSRRRLRSYEWVRACMGTPAVILMAFPERGASSSSQQGLVQLLDYVRGKGSALFLISDRATLLDALGRIIDWQELFNGSLS